MAKNPCMKKTHPFNWMFFILGIYQSIQTGWFFQSIYVFSKSHQFDIHAMPFIGCLALPFTLKWMWAPLTDYLTRFRWTYRMEVRYLLRLSGILWLTLAVLYTHFTLPFWIIMALIAHAAVCLDNSIDAFRIYAFPEDTQPFLLRANVLGYRLGLGLFSGGIVLSTTWVAWWPWFIVIGIIALGASYSIPHTDTQQELRKHKSQKLEGLFSLPVLCAAVAIRCGDGWISGLLILYLIHCHNWDSYSIGLFYQMIGGIAAMMGSFVAPWLLSRYPLEYILSRSLLMGVMLTFMWLWSFHFTYPMLIASVIVWNLWIGFYALFFSQWLTEHTSQAIPGTHFSLLTSLARIPGLLSGWLSGPILASHFPQLVFLLGLGGYLASFLIQRYLHTTKTNDVLY